MRFLNKTAVVTGASGSIGGAIAMALAAEGADVALVDLKASDLVSHEISKLGRKQPFVRADISNSSEVASAIARAVSELGGLDILVNAAGIISYGLASDLPESVWDNTINTNLKGVFLCSQAAIGPLRERGGGRIISIGSITGKNGGNGRPWLDPDEQTKSGNLAYGISKSGVHTMTTYLARELATSNITVNAVAPGPVKSVMTDKFSAKQTALIPLGRVGLPREIAAAVLFLASEDASFITGEIMDVNGGAWSD